jgi:hypothetical protein
VHTITLVIVVIKWQLFVFSYGYWFNTFENVSCRATCKHKILCVATQIFRNVRILEEVYGKLAMKKMQAYEWHKHS